MKSKFKRALSELWTRLLAGQSEGHDSDFGHVAFLNSQSFCIFIYISGMYHEFVCCALQLRHVPLTIAFVFVKSQHRSVSQQHATAAATTTKNPNDHLART